MGFWAGTMTQGVRAFAMQTPEFDSLVPMWKVGYDSVCSCNSSTGGYGGQENLLGLQVVCLAGGGKILNSCLRGIR